MFTKLGVLGLAATTNIVLAVGAGMVAGILGTKGIQWAVKKEAAQAPMVVTPR